MSSAALAGSALTSSRAFAAPSDRIRVAVVGVRGQGNGHIGAYSRMPNVEIAALCDIDQNVLNSRLAQVEKTSGKRPTGYEDLRKLLEDKDIDAISIATPNHNHTMQAIWALQAGKHVYVEKPCSHNIFEAKQIVAATRKYGKIVQHGVNARSHGGPMEAVAKMREGLIGDVYMARGLCFKRRDTIGTAKPEAPPSGVNYDLWLGPAPKTEFTRNRFHYTWHWFWAYGNGDFGNQGIHELDIARWGLGVKYPTKVMAMGEKFMFNDDQETPNVLNVNYHFDDGPKKRMLTFEVRHWDTNNEGTQSGVSNMFYGSGGYLGIDGYNKYTSQIGEFVGETRPGQGAGLSRQRKLTPGPEKNQGGSNWANFIDAVRANKKELQNNEIEEGAISVTLMHLGNISYRLGRAINFDPVKLEITGDKEASAMMTRQYRAPFIVPAKV